MLTLKGQGQNLTSGQGHVVVAHSGTGYGLSLARKPAAKAATTPSSWAMVGSGLTVPRRRRTASQRGTPQEDVLRNVRYFSAQTTEGSRAPLIAALAAFRRRSAASPMEVWRRPAPVASPQLVDVHRGVPVFDSDQAW